MTIKSEGTLTTNQKLKNLDWRLADSLIFCAIIFLLFSVSCNTKHFIFLIIFYWTIFFDLYFLINFYLELKKFLIFLLPFTLQMINLGILLLLYFIQLEPWMKRTKMTKMNTFCTFIGTNINIVGRYYTQRIKFQTMVAGNI